MDEDQLSISIDRDPLKAQQEGSAVTLLKLHGDLHHPQRMVATERDYESFLHRYPLISTYLANLLISRTAVLIGYSLDDPDFRQIWNLISSRLGSLRRPAYCIAVGASASYIAKFARRGVQVINLPARAAKGVVLAEAFEELRDYFTANTLAASQAVDEESLQQFKLPVDSASRLCFFSVPLKLVPIYREIVYPIAREFGFVPVSADEVISPGDAIVPKILALIDRAELVIVDVPTAGSPFELQLALARLGSERVLAIAETSETSIRSDMRVVRRILRPKDFSVGDGDFVGVLRQWFEARSQELQPKISAEPMRLLEMREYRAAIISAISLLEVSLRELLPSVSDSKGHLTAIGSLLAEALNAQLLRPQEVGRAREWLALRNQVVHTNFVVPQELASGTVLGVLEMIHDVRNRRN